MDETEDTMRTARDRRFRYIRNHHPDRPYFQHLDYAEGFPTWRVLRVRRQQEAMQRGHGDLSRVPEAELIERWRPGGVAPATAAPAVRVEDGQVTAACATDGASIGWTADPPAPDPPMPSDPGARIRAVGGPDLDSRRWRVYLRHFAAPPGATLWFRAHRIGYRPSPDVAVST